MDVQGADHRHLQPYRNIFTSEWNMSRTLSRIASRLESVEQKKETKAKKRRRMKETFVYPFQNIFSVGTPVCAGNAMFLTFFFSFLFFPLFSSKRRRYSMFDDEAARVPNVRNTAQARVLNRLSLLYSVFGVFRFLAAIQRRIFISLCDTNV